MGRTALSAAIPIVRSIDMAAAGVAGMLAPMLGLNAEEEQAKVFRDAEVRSARMRQMYEPQAGEQMSKTGQIAGGIASIPLEMAGGMGVQRGVERAADVVQRGGTVGEAAVAGGVTGAANVAANLLPVKAGGAVGRVVENALGRGLGARAGQVAGGALTGGVLGAAGDVGVTEASNAALPEGQQFADLKQESDPLTSFGLGAAFGGLGAHGERVGARKAASAAGEVKQPQAKARAGAEAPAGSVGAAGADVERMRRERAAALPVPIELSKGEAMDAETGAGGGDKFAQMNFERETAKDAELGAPLREAAAEKNERLQRNIDAMIDMTGAEKPDRREAGDAIVKAISKKMEARRGEVDKAYAKAREAGDMAEPVSYAGLRNYIDAQTPTTREQLAPIIKMVDEQLAKSDPSGTGEIPIADLEDIRQSIRKNTQFGTPNSVHGGELINRIDAATKDAGGDLYREARRQYADYAGEFKNRAVVANLLNKKRGMEDRRVDLEDVFSKSVLGAGHDDVKHLRRVLQTAGADGAQAWKELQGQALQHIREQALGNTSRDIRGNPIVSVAKLDKAIKGLDADGRLELIFGKKGAEQLRDLNDVASNVLTSPPGSVNTSNTASTWRNMMGHALDTMVTFSASGIPVPALAVLKKSVQTFRERGVRKRVAEALKQPEGMQAAPSGESPFTVEPLGERTQIQPERVQRPAVERSVPDDARLAEIQRLRAGASPETLKALDEHEKVIKREIQAQQLKDRRDAEALNLEKAAARTDDSGIKAALIDRANKLRSEKIPVGDAEELTSIKIPVEKPGRIPAGKATELAEVPGPRVTEPSKPLPVGSAREVTVIDQQPAAPVEPTQIPTGEATELTAENVEPAPRPTEPPRTAAGSDADAELTMLQPGAPARGPLKRVAKPEAEKRGALPAQPFKQRRELETALRAKLGHKLVDGLLQRNVITMGDAPADVPRDAQGRFTGNTVELFHDRLDAATAPGVLMHEVGMHYGMEKMLGEQRYAELMADLAKMRQRPEVAKAWQAVVDNYPLQEGSPEFLSEVAAHLVESAPDRPIVRRMLDAPRAYLYKNFGVNISRTDPALVRALAVGALRKSAGVEAVSPNPTALATAGARQESGADYNTDLSEKEEAQFRQWVAKNKVPFDVDAAESDYDMRGFWKAAQQGDKRASTAINANDGRIHFPDYWKTPSHRTFSNESKWAKPDSPHWEGDRLIGKNGRVVFDEAAVH